MPHEDQLTPVERRIAKSFEDTGGAGKPLPRRALKSRRSLEAYLRAGLIPRYVERLNQIDREVRSQKRVLERAYRQLQAACDDDAELFSRQWRAIAESWSFERLNELIREHNEWYPIERGLPMDPKTRDYVAIRGRSYRRAELGSEWILANFAPPLP